MDVTALSAATVFHTKRVKKCVFDILLHISGINCPTVMLYVSLFPIEAILQRVPLGFNLDKVPSGHVNPFDV